MTLKLIGFLLFFLFGSTLISIFAGFLYIFLVQAPLLWVVVVLLAVAALPFAGLCYFQKAYLKLPISMEEVMIGGCLSLLIIIYGLTMTYGLRSRLQQLEKKTRPARVAVMKPPAAPKLACNS